MCKVKFDQQEHLCNLSCLLLSKRFSHQQIEKVDHLECWASNKSSREESESGGNPDHHWVTCQDSSSKSEPTRKMSRSFFLGLAKSISHDSYEKLEVDPKLVSFILWRLAFENFYQSPQPIYDFHFLDTYFEMTTPERRMPTTEERAFVKPPEFPGIIKWFTWALLTI